MAHVVEHIIRGSFLHNATGIHHCYILTDLCHNAKVMGDHEHGHFFVTDQLFHELQHLRLNGYIQSGGRLIRDQKLRAAGQRNRNDNTLLHAAGELMRVIVSAGFRDTYHL